LRSYGYNLIDDEDRTVNDGDLLEKEIVRVVARKTGCTN
jgi:hypothetical protein